MTEFVGRTVLVTGASRGIGRAVAEHFLGLGANVVANVRGTAGDTFPATMTESGRFLSFAADLRHEEQIRALVDATVERFDGLDVLVNNAGVDEPRAILDIDAAHLERVWSVNVRGLVLTSSFGARVMARRGRGVIVNIASVAAKEGSAFHTAYVSSKHAVLGVTRCAAQELMPHGIRVNAVCPGLIDTDMPRRYYTALAELTGGTADQYLTEQVRRTPRQRMGTPADVAALVAFVSSDRAANIVGQAINTDGGLLDH